MSVVHAAANLADVDGFHKVTLAAVAAQLGVRTPSLYNHIEGLRGLHRELALFGIRELGERLGMAAIGKASDDAIKAILSAYRSFAKERPGLYEATLHAPDNEDPEVQKAAQSVVEILLTVLEPYSFGDDDAIHVVRGFRSIAHGFVSLEVAGAFGLPLEIDESYRRLIEIFLRGLHSSEDKVEND